VSVIVKSRGFSPRVVIQRLLISYFRENLGKNIDEVRSEDLKEFFNDFSWHFTEADIDEFLAEVNDIAVESLPGFMHDSLECSYK
jgi:hypothetical protein